MCIKQDATTPTKILTKLTTNIFRLKKKDATTKPCLTSWECQKAILNKNTKKFRISGSTHFYRKHFETKP